MPHFEKPVCRSMIYRFFLNNGRLPAATTTKNWEDVTIEQLRLDDPPLQNNPTFERRQCASDIQNLFFNVGGSVASPFDKLCVPELTLLELADWCYENQ